MAHKKVSTEQLPEDTALVSAAKSIGAVAGKIASFVGVTSEAPAKSLKTRKLPPKNKSRLPRVQKKAQKKVRSSTGAV